MQTVVVRPQEIDGVLVDDFKDTVVVSLKSGNTLILRVETIVNSNSIHYFGTQDIGEIVSKIMCMKQEVIILDKSEINLKKNEAINNIMVSFKNNSAKTKDTELQNILL
jgi:hypothetical protein